MRVIGNKLTTTTIAKDQSRTNWRSSEAGKQEESGTLL